MSLNKYQRERRLKTRHHISSGGRVIDVNYSQLDIIDRREVLGFGDLARRSPQGATIRVSISSAVSLPSGFFGVLLDAVEAGRTVLLLDATPEVRALTGYQKFVGEDGVVHL